MNKQPGSWLALVAFCVVTALAAALGFSILFADGSVAFAVAQSSPASAETRPEVAEATVARPAQLMLVDDGAPVQIFAGVITDSRCGARHSMKSGKSPAECVRSCVRSGAKYVLVDGETNHALDGDSRQFEQLAGERVEVAGMLVGDTIRVKSVTSR